MIVSQGLLTLTTSERGQSTANCLWLMLVRELASQVAGQQGAYLASLFKSAPVRPGQPLPKDAKPFRYNHRGSLAYVGGDKAVMDIPRFGPLKGYGAGVLWRGFETFRQISFRNQCLVASDWIKRRIFGRDVEFGRTDA